ncbi:hypothetical protein XOC_3612 [Xanthomonas oryzae pv. oryzicola BLS256]|uniref:Uncharacterized protein n=1 Tax=Xanthomonas oryzae pv. oryzicola (strain BLS256) TaxID=383407 RepID=G7TEZ5_XANOB|nr:hypothetical protein XOC_3612 [Xanthomonas oryzae pv. oryzicola BLS256]QEO96138.1 hypothetical protein XOCgx_1144 [Xanthomonas oryzae pv. oryzicola]
MLMCESVAESAVVQAPTAVRPSLTPRNELLLQKLQIGT